jgi:hypothetical protein
MTIEELARALLGAMQQRSSNPLHPVSRNSAVSELNSIVDPISPIEWRRLEVKLEPLFRKAFDQLERWELIESKYGQSETSGYIVLTEKGIAATAKFDYENLRQRRLLVPEMLHPNDRRQLELPVVLPHLRSLPELPHVNVTHSELSFPGWP